MKGQLEGKRIININIDTLLYINIDTHLYKYSSIYSDAFQVLFMFLSFNSLTIFILKIV